MLTAAILAGGKSARMGSNKALVPFRGKPMVSAVVGAARPVVTDLIVVSDDGATYAELGCRTIADIHKACGPLGGLHAALTASTTDDVLLLACDIPLVSTALLHYLSTHPSRADARVAEVDGRVHPLCGVYSKRCLPAIEQLIASGRLAMASLLDAVGAERIAITPDLPCYRPNLLTNINDPSTLRSEEPDR